MNNSSTALWFHLITNSTILWSDQAELAQIQYVFGLATCPVCVVGFISSILCLYFIITNYRKLQSSTTRLFVNVSASSLLFSTLVLPVISYTLMSGENNSFALGKQKEFCRVSGWFYVWAILVSGYSHSAIALNRFFVVVLARHFPILNSTLVTEGLSLSVWGFPMIVSFLPFVGIGGGYGWMTSQYRCSLNRSTAWFNLFYRIVYSFFPLILMVLCYTSILYFLLKAKKKRRMTGTVDQRTEQSRLASRQFKKEQNATWVALVTCSAFMVFFSPTALLAVAIPSQTVTSRSMGALWLQIGCAVNPFIYMLLSSGHRMAFCARILRLKPSVATISARPGHPAASVDPSKKF